MMKLHKSWQEKLELDQPYIQDLKQFLSQEKAHGSIIYPPEHLVFSAFSHTPFENVKVVLMGQDPYHGEHQAHGLCFSVMKGIKPPPSLKNIYKEMKQDLGIDPPTHGCLTSWADQGVLMLNATLSVRKGEPKSHFGKGWEIFTDHVIDLIAQRTDPIVFILWGKSAKDKCLNILDKRQHPHLVLTAAHPSPYSATQFFGCGHFSKANQFLAKSGKTPINWKIEE